MLSKSQMEKYADVLLWALNKARGVRFKKGEIILLRYDLPGLSMAEILQERILTLGLNPVLRTGVTPPMERTFYQKADPRQLVFQPPGEKELYENLNGAIYLHAPICLTHLAAIDPKRIGKAAVARKPLRDILTRREERRLFGWTLCTLPTEEQARQAGLTLRQYTREIVRACYLDDPHPVQAWESVYREAKKIKAWLNGMEVEYYHVRSENTELKITPGDRRKWVGISGHNMPSFELFLSPDWRGTEGTYYADQPSFRNGNYVKGVRLFFRSGRAVGIEAKEGRSFVQGQLKADKGACRVGEFSLTDKRFSRICRFMANTLFDENFGGRCGNCHLAVGASYSDTYDGDPAELTKDKKERLGFNDSAIPWDLVNTEKKTVTAHLKGGRTQVIYEDGIFTI